MRLKERLANKQILLFDGGMGTELQKYNPTESDFPKNKQGFSDGLNYTHPEWIKSIYKKYLEAGADCITTNTFGSNKIKLDEHGYGDKTTEFNQNAAMLARETADLFEDRYVIGSIGPTGYLPSIMNPPAEERSLDEIEEAFYLQILGLLKGGVDGLVLETGQDILELKMAISAIKRTGTKVPILANITLGQANNMLLGTPTESAYATLSGMGIDTFGLNCSTGPKEMINSIQWLDENSDHPIMTSPNAGIPDMDNAGEYPMQPDEMAEIVAEMIKKYKKIKIVGGCCGTTPTHIRALRKVIDRSRPTQ